MIEDQDIDVGEILNIFGSNQQKITAAETKIVQLKRACQHKEEHIERLLEEQVCIQSESYDLNKKESSILIELECLREANNSIHLSRSNTQLALSKKERQLTEMNDTHKTVLSEKLNEIACITDKLLEQRRLFSKTTMQHESNSN
mmetsp:Transcript_3363/g.6107  ORF Transcript_3363/g.6107 Transcript_3363/m.6107 type:complete len:145 (-) Transcript_3363:2403-2837(-)